MQHIEQARRAQRHYWGKSQQVGQQQRKAEEYLEELKKTLNNPMLSDANRQTTLSLVDSLTTSIAHYELMMLFFRKVAQHFQGERFNLEHRLKNLEIMDFLNNQDKQQDLAEVERTRLQLDFQQDILRLEAKLPKLDAQMGAQGQLLSEDLRHELGLAIERLEA